MEAALRLARAAAVRDDALRGLLPSSAVRRTRLQERNVRQPSLRSLGLAVVVAGVAAIAVVSVQQLGSRTATNASKATVQEYSTGAGQRARLTLPDSSTVILAPESRVRYVADFSS